MSVIEHHHTGDPQTSVDAAEVTEKTLSERCALVLGAVARYPMTGPEASLLFPEWNTTASTNVAAKRMSDLVTKGLVVPVEGKTRALPGSRPSQVWRIADDADGPPNPFSTPIADLLVQAIGDLKHGRADSLRQCPFKVCDGRDPFPSKSSFSRHLRTIHGANAAMSGED